MDHRYGRRVAISISVQMHFGNGMASWGVARNISRDGMFIETAAAVPCDRCVDVRLTTPMPAGERTVPIPGFVVHGTENGFGMMFRMLDREARETVTRLLGAKERPAAQLHAGMRLAGAARSESVGAIRGPGTRTSKERWFASPKPP